MFSFKATFMACAFFILGLSAEAKDLNSRLGVGYVDNLPFTAPGIGAIYYPNSNIGLVGGLGIDTQDQNSKFGLSGGLRRIIFKEQNMNFFMGGRLSILSSEVNGSTNSGFELAGTAGGEFFFQGLENLGLNFETGIGVSSLNKVRVRTIADSPLRAGVFFYF